MLTRVMLIIAVLGLVIFYFGITQNSTPMMLIGFGAIIVGLIGANQSAKNKKGMGFLGWLWKRL